RGRIAAASFCVVALGKLGSRELNYASDIDLLFLYSADGTTSGAGARGSITNREYFGKLAERVARLAGQPTGEGAAYRVDLRLRPHGRDGALACSLQEAARYYRESAQAWELQTLIRARASAGAAALYARFAEAVRARVYRKGETVERALEYVRLAKQKIDRFHTHDTGGFNVKLGRGGIREIEFIAQALQVAYGGDDEWLRAPHTLISLGRLHDRGFISERERSALSDAYTFLRTLEHRVQMEHGLQTHVVPDDATRRALVARRMHFKHTDALQVFDRELAKHTSSVRAVYERVFGSAGDAGDDESAPQSDAQTRAGAVGAQRNADATELKINAGAVDTGRTAGAFEAKITAGAFESERSDDASLSVETKRDALTAHARVVVVREPPADAETAAANAAAALLAPRLAESARGETRDVERLARFLRERAEASLNARRALTLTARVAASLDKSDESSSLNTECLSALVSICGASEFFGEMLASNPSLLRTLTEPCAAVAGERDYRALLRAAIDKERTFGGELSALRCAWAHMLVELGACDVRGEISAAESNRLQTNLAAASINAGYLIARRELARRYGRLANGPRLGVLGLGRLGSAGTDYGSDLDIVLIYDEAVPSPLAGQTREEAYGRLAEILSASLSSMTRDGYLYRVDTRLRPDGKNGATTSASRAFVQYLRERASVWEWLAYVKLRAVAGDMEFGRTIEREARRAIHEAAQLAGAETLRIETRRMRERLEREHTRRGTHATDIKFGTGGMLDVYFAVRYLQLRDHIPDDEPDRSTRATLARLYAAGSLAPGDFRALHEGYTLLRTLDHFLRIIAGRSTRLPAEGHPALRDLARRAGYDSSQALTQHLATHMQAIHAAYERVTT
ncbi:MAG TPA: hypothetical protein VNA19_06830, partial [Pyrinomonadaceae bacterium]|nr:hypothetical protein [Pyrinomonadaceae bacterium]